VAALHRPAVFMCSAEDMLFGHLDRLPPLREGQSIVRLAYDPAAKHQAITDLAAALPGEGAAPPAPRAALAGADPAKGFVDAPDGQVFVRAYGDRAKPAVLLAHDGPGAGLALEALARDLSARAFVVVPDLPGMGDSEAPPSGRSLLEAAGGALGAVADGLDLPSFILAAVGSGCSAAALFAATGDPRLTAVLLADPQGPDDLADEIFAPELGLSPLGAHWLQAWLMLRDNQIYKPWFDGRVSAQRKTQGNFDAEWLHDQTVALMRSRETYHRYLRAARRHDPIQTLKRARAPVRVADGDDLAALIASTLVQNG
jgi:pimeloyl-ACP methyl ester carboxylesterase